ncbi:methyltransferase type 11 [Neosynechococcus sphagnicola sy1]|uniref:Methyltransferase type 11 n=2 Tax=Neosynechococcus TaxID=1501143 RepID=A0A098TML2_9CYAN|nr:methyltransferase type 11 [Neosynechococcus sphagnicola sy1]
MSAFYDAIAPQFQQSRALPFRHHVEAYTYLNLIGEVTDQRILDLACGEGTYSRLLKQRGAARVVGVDISAQMIALAQQAEATQPLGIEYIVCDVQALGQIGDFDQVVASYLLNHAPTREQLLGMCQTIFANLKPGGRFVSINNHLEQPPETYGICEQYGFTKQISGDLREGTPITVSFPSEGSVFSIEDYYLSQDTYECALQTAGFPQVQWHSLSISPEGLQVFGADFWQDCLDYPPIIGISCQKPGASDS